MAPWNLIQCSADRLNRNCWTILHVASKCDLARRDDADLCVSAVTGENVDSLVATVRDRLVPLEDLHNHGPWLFDPRLES